MYMIIFRWLLFLGISLVSHNMVVNCTASDTLVQLHVVFRHGERTPDIYADLYPNDPYINETYYPYGVGQLTKQGRITEYNIGKQLRKRYGDFLGPSYVIDMVDAWSTGYNRTKMSLELVLASLFRPSREEMFQKDLYWQPVPYNYRPTNQDAMLYGLECPNFRNYTEQSERYLATNKEYKDTIELVKTHGGGKVLGVYDLYEFYFILLVQREFNLTLPQWTKSIYPDLLREVAIENYSLLTNTVKLKKLLAGYLLKKIVDDSEAKIKQKPAIGKKIFLYSGHESNIGFLLATLGAYKPHIPPYGAYLMVELHLIKETYGFKVFYQNYEQTEPKLLLLPGCGEFCPLDTFLFLNRAYFPDENTCSNKQ